MRPQLVDSGPGDRAATQRVAVRRVRGGEASACDDLVAVEEPLEIRILAAGQDGPGEAVSVTMRTPGHDAELAVGFLHGEGVIRSRQDIAAVRERGPDGNVVCVELSSASAATTRLPRRRNFYATSSCGVCGMASLAALEELMRPSPVDMSRPVAPEALRALEARAREAQPVFRDTGGLHAASLFDGQGAFVASFEDVGRHNALDKLVGRMLLDGRLPLAGHMLHLSGRASFELVQKAAAAGVPIVAAVGAPSSLAVALAGQAGILLVGFLRGDSFNVYAHAERLA
jgi:FdhD protein